MLVSSQTTQAQQDIQFSQFREHALIHNPAAAGIYDGINLHALARFQWQGLEGAPLSQAISADIAVPYLSSGWGITIINNIEGALRVSNAHFVYSYHQKINRDFIISIGAGLGVQQQSINSQKLITPEGNYSDESVMHNDNLLNNSNFSAIAPSANLGALVRYKKLKAGIAFEGGLFSEFNFNDLNTNITNPIKLSFIADYEQELSDVWSITPSAQFKTSFIYNQLDIGASANWNNFLSFGINWRGYNNSNFDAFVGIVALKLNNQLSVTYSYDYTISKINFKSNGSHEIGIQYAIKGVRNQSNRTKKIYNTRYL